MSLTKEDIESAIEEAFDRRMAVDIHLHAKHHQIIDQLIEQRDRRTRFYDGVKRQVVGWGIIAFLGAVGAMSYQAFINLVRKIGGH